ncbi:MAG TPA: peroxiredoxin [Blastocatellia bacterium]|nr:peroxiredoxin [Blastocatellia bacterium]
MKRMVILLGLLLALTVLSVNGQNGGAGKAGGDSAEGPQVGQAAPDFELPWATQEKLYLARNEWLKLSSLQGANVILAFYPADWSGGCTTEVCTFRDSWNDLGKLDAKLLAISGDYVFSHQEWAKHHKLDFPLLSDHDHAIAKLYGSYQPALGGINKRTVYLIDKKGVVQYKNLAFKAGAKEDYEALRAALMKLQSPQAK